MRLIDADELVKFLKGCTMSNGTLINTNIMLSVIDKMPTAYDVEKVVEELACNSRFIDDINEHNIKCISCVIGQKTAIDIVRKGGVE